MIQKIAAPGVFLINLYDPIQLAPLYRDMRELSTLGFWAPRSGDLPNWAKDRFPYMSPGFRTSKPGGVEREVLRYKHLSTYKLLKFDFRWEIRIFAKLYCCAKFSSILIIYLRQKGAPAWSK